jgi:hypothetical protein
MVQIVEALCSKSSTTKEKKRMWSQINAEAGGSLGPGVPGKPGQYRDTILKKKERERREERRGEESRAGSHVFSWEGCPVESGCRLEIFEEEEIGNWLYLCVFGF